MSADRVALIQSKVVTDKRLRMAIAVKGDVSINTNGLITNWLSERKGRTDALSKLRQLLTLVREDASKANRIAPGPPAKLFVIAWTGKAKAFVVDNVIMPVASCAGPESSAPFGIERIEDQRRQKNTFGWHTVGGAAELVTVSAKGIETEIIRRWPDRIGELITPQ